MKGKNEVTHSTGLFLGKDTMIFDSKNKNKNKNLLVLGKSGRGIELKSLNLWATREFLLDISADYQFETGVYTYEEAVEKLKVSGLL